MLRNKNSVATEDQRRIDIKPIGGLQFNSKNTIVKFTGDLPKTISWTSTITKEDASDEHIFFDGFHPIPLRNCLSFDLEKLDTKSTFPTLTYKLTIKTPSGWEALDPTDQQEMETPKVAFAMTNQTPRKSLRVNGLPIEILARNQGLTQLDSTIKTVIGSHMTWMGPFPFKKLYIVESSYLESFSMPGFVILNRPKQAIFDSLQSEWLNWSHWAMTTLIAYQWVIPQISTTQEKDHWFFQGFIDFITETALAMGRTRHNLFNAYDLDLSVLSMNYREMQNLTAALLEKYAPFAKLTDQNFETLTPYEDQHPLLFIRHALALRHLHRVAGTGPLQRFFRKFVKNTSKKPFKPAEFINILNSLPSPFSGVKRRRVQSHLNAWWTRSGWPDYSFESFTAKKLSDWRYLTTINLEQEGDFHFPVEIEVRSKLNQTKRGVAKPNKDGKFSTTILTPFEPYSVDIDPERHIYDRNRFNNSNHDVKVDFFPGSATTLKDDAYTIFWIPYFLRRPGEKLALGVQSILFKYLSGEMTARVESQLDGKVGFFIQKKDKVPQYALALEGMLAQDFEGFRESKFVTRRSPLIKGGADLSLSLKLRERRIVGSPKTSHATYAISTTLKPGFQNKGCDYQYKAEYEVAPKTWAKDFQYERITNNLLGSCGFSTGIVITSRAFKGDLHSDDELPSNILFKPENLGEARIRMDIGGSERPRNIISLSNDVYFPFTIPLPSGSVVLGRQLKWRLFYDIGQSKAPSLKYDAHGVGLLLPLGGDFIGAGSLALTRFSLLAVLHSRAGDRVNKRTSFLFDVTGDL